MNRKMLLKTMFLNLPKDQLADVAADLMLAGIDSPEESQTAPETAPTTRGGKRITKEEIDTVLRCCSSFGEISQDSLERLASELGRSTGAIRQIVRAHWEPAPLEEKAVESGENEGPEPDGSVE